MTTLLQLFVSIPDLQEEVFAQLELLVDQITLANVLVPALGLNQTIKVLVFVNRHGLFLNNQLVAHIFNTPAFKGDNHNQNLRPTKHDYGNEDATAASYAVLLQRMAFASDQAGAATLHRTRDGRVVKLRNSMALQSKQRRMGQDKPSEERKLQLGLFRSDGRTYPKLLKDHAGYDPEFRRTQIARDEDEEEKMRVQDKFKSFQKLFANLITDMSIFPSTCRGCFKKTGSTHTRIPTIYCRTCRSTYAKWHLFKVSDAMFLQLLNIYVPNYLFQQVMHPWFSPVYESNEPYLTDAEMRILHILVFGPGYAPQYMPAGPYSMELCNELTFRFTTVTGAMRAAALAYARYDSKYRRELWNIPQNYLDYPPVGLLDEALCGMASRVRFNMKIDIEKLEFAQRMAIFMARAFDEEREVVDAEPAKWQRNIVAAFWHTLLEEDFGLYTYDRMYQLFHLRPIKAFESFTMAKSFRPDSTCDYREAELYSFLTHGCAPQEISNIPHSKKAHNLSRFRVIATVATHILNSYDTRLVEACMELFAMVYGSNDGFTSFVHTIFDWLHHNVPLADQAGFALAGQVPEDAIRSYSSLFWTNFLTDATANKLSMFHTTNGWATGAQVEITISNSNRDYPGSIPYCLYFLGWYEVISFSTDGPNIGHITARRLI